eukprot:gene9641-7554_t
MASHPQPKVLITVFFPTVQVLEMVLELDALSEHSSLLHGSHPIQKVTLRTVVSVPIMFECLGNVSAISTRLLHGFPLIRGALSSSVSFHMFSAGEMVTLSGTRLLIGSQPYKKFSDAAVCRFTSFRRMGKREQESAGDGRALSGRAFYMAPTLIRSVLYQHDYVLSSNMSVAVDGLCGSSLFLFNCFSCSGDGKALSVRAFYMAPTLIHEVLVTARGFCSNMFRLLKVLLSSSGVCSNMVQVWDMVERYQARALLHGSHPHYRSASAAVFLSTFQVLGMVLVKMVEKRYQQRVFTKAPPVIQSAPYQAVVSVRYMFSVLGDGRVANQHALLLAPTRHTEVLGDVERYRHRASTAPTLIQRCSEQHVSVPTCSVLGSGRAAIRHSAYPTWLPPSYRSALSSSVSVSNMFSVLGLVERYQHAPSYNMADPPSYMKVLEMCKRYQPRLSYMAPPSNTEGASEQHCVCSTFSGAEKWVERRYQSTRLLQQLHPHTEGALTSVWSISTCSGLEMVERYRPRLPTGFPPHLRLRDGKRLSGTRLLHAPPSYKGALTSRVFSNHFVLEMGRALQARAFYMAPTLIQKVSDQQCVLFQHVQVLGDGRRYQCTALTLAPPSYKVLLAAVVCSTFSAGRGRALSGTAPSTWLPPSYRSALEQQWCLFQHVSLQLGDGERYQPRASTLLPPCIPKWLESSVSVPNIDSVLEMVERYQATQPSTMAPTLVQKDALARRVSVIHHMFRSAGMSRAL